MASDVLSQSFFGVYEFFANIIPGMLLIVTILFTTNSAIALPNGTILNETLLSIIIIFLAFIIGLAIQGISASVEKLVNKKKYGGYPSSLYLTAKDATFPTYFKDRIRELVKKKFGTPTDSSSSHIFDLCYTYVMQKRVSDRVSEFLKTYTFSRNMVVTMMFEAIISFYSAYNLQQVWFIAAGFGSIGLSYIFYKRFLRYGESFAKEVLRSFFVNEIENTAIS
jgi:hypothetical protein